MIKNRIQAARGNWNPDVIKPKTRCYVCTHVISLKDSQFVRIDGIRPAHKPCADSRGYRYTLGPEIHKLGTLRPDQLHGKD